MSNVCSSCIKIYFKVTISYEKTELPHQLTDNKLLLGSIFASNIVSLCFGIKPYSDSSNKNIKFNRYEAFSVSLACSVELLLKPKTSRKVAPSSVLCCALSHVFTLHAALLCSCFSLFIKVLPQ